MLTAAGGDVAQYATADHGRELDYETAAASAAAQPAQQSSARPRAFGSPPFRDPTVTESPKARIVFLSSLLATLSQGSSDTGPKTTLLLKDRTLAVLLRERLAAQLNLFDDPQVLVLDLDGIAFTPSTLQELIVPLAQRIRGGEHGTVRLVISTTDPGVGDFVRYIAQVHELPLYLSSSPSNLRQATPVGNLTTTERSTLDTIIELGGQVTASRLAATEGIKPSAATNRLVRLDQEGYLVRQPRGRREGDAYIEPRSATSIYTVSDTGTGSAHLSESTLSMTAH